ncbi:MAG: 2-amino-4-hydroxy-6-hydroxymethyldihydropteridine diphosphokinase [Oscillospiraceae bacterium]
MRAVIAFGTNIGDRAKNIEDAIASFNLLPKTKVIKISKIYETKPWGYENQENFYNGVILIETEFSKQAILGACLGIESGMGRVRNIKNGPRIIDLDVLFYENETSNTDELMLPHPQILNRVFVLVPLSDIFKNGIAFDYDFNSALKLASKEDIKEIKLEL